MDNARDDTGRPLRPNLHRTIYKVMIGCAFVMGAGAWLFAGGKGTYSIAFAAVGIFAVVVAILPNVLARFGRRRAAPETESLHDWSQGDLDVYGHDPIKAPSAAVIVLIAPVAGAIGLVALAVVARLVTGGAI